MFAGKVTRYGFAVMAVVTPVIAAVVIFGEGGQASDVEHVLYVTSIPTQAYVELDAMFHQAEEDYAGDGDRAQRFGLAHITLRLLHDNAYFEANVLRGGDGLRSHPFPGGKTIPVNIEYSRYEETLNLIQLQHASNFTSIAEACFDLAATPWLGMSPKLRAPLARFNLEMGKAPFGGLPLDFCRNFALEGLENFGHYNHPSILKLMEGLAGEHPELELEIPAIRAMTPVWARILARGSATPMEINTYDRYAQVIETVNERMIGLFSRKDAKEFEAATQGMHSLRGVIEWSMTMNLKGDQPQFGVSS